jgi:hypothetical protein
MNPQDPSTARPDVGPPRRPARARLALAATGAGLALLLAACGSSAKASSAAPSTASASTPTTLPATTAPTGGGNAANAAALQAYRACLTQNGVTLPAAPTTVPGATTVPGQRGAGGGGGGLQSVITDPANQAAVTACASLRPAGFGQANPARTQAMQAYYSCLGDNGVTVPTTVAGGAPPSIDRTTPAFTAANAKCQALLPQRTGSSTTPPTTVVGG